MTTRRLLGAAALAGLAGAALPVRAARGQSGGTLLDILTSARDLSRFAAIVRQAGMEDEFSRPGSFGVFIPHNAAVEKISAIRLRELEGDREVMRRTVLHHISGFSEQILAGGSGNSTGMSRIFRSAAGGTLSLEYGSGSLPRVNGAPIFVANMRASNGLAHCVDEVLAL